MDDKNPMIDKMQKATTELFVLSALIADCHPKRPSVPCSAVSV